MPVEILEDRDAWLEAYETGWLKKYLETGETDWKIYKRPDNKQAPSGRGVELSNSRLVLISSAGGYLKAEQEPFDAPNLLGDYTVRRFSIDTPFEQIAYAHEHYDHTAVNADPQVLLPLRHLADFVAEGYIGELAPDVISYSGYHPDLVKVVDDLIPLIVGMVKEMQADAALLVPS